MGKLKFVALTLIFISILTSVCYATEDISQEFFEFADGEFDYTYINEKLSFDNIIGNIFSVIKSQARNCAHLISSVMSLIVLITLLSNFNFNDRKELKNVITSTICIAIFAIVLDTVQNNIEFVRSAIDKSKVFSISAIPIILTLCISSGESFSASVFSSSVSICSAIFQIISNHIIIPLIFLYLLFGIVSVYSDDFNVYAICEIIKKFYKWLIGVFVGIYTFAVSLQNVLSKASDNFTKKTVQTAVSKIIPIVGGTLSGTVESVFCLAATTKTSAGIFGALVIISMFLPVILGNICYGLCMLLCKYISSLFNLNKLTKVIGLIADVFFFLSALASACGFMLLISFFLICINI